MVTNERVYSKSVAIYDSYCINAEFTSQPQTSISEVSEIAGQLQSVMVKNPKKARHTCTKEYRLRKASEAKDQVEELNAEPSVASESQVVVAEAEEESNSRDQTQVWEISDDENDSFPLLPGKVIDTTGSFY